MIERRQFVLVAIAVSTLAAIGGALVSTGLSEPVEAPETPTGLEASKGEHAGRVVLEWTAGGGATAYRVYRDGEPVGVASGDSWVDFDADPGGIPEAPEVEVGEFPDRVEVQWNEPEVGRGSVHAYQVRAVGEDAESRRSAPAAGWRAGESVTGYLMQVGECRWIEVGNRTNYVDFDVGEPTVDPGEISVHQEGRDLFRLRVDGADLESGPVSDYRVRAVNDVGVGEPSEVVGGRIDGGGLEYRWERAEGEAPEDFESISEARSSTYRTTGFDGEQSPPRFRAVVDAQGAEAAESEPVEGMTSREGDFSGRVWVGGRDVAPEQLARAATGQKCSCRDLADEQRGHSPRICGCSFVEDEASGLREEAVTRLIAVFDEDYWYVTKFATTPGYYSAGQAGGRVSVRPGEVVDRQGDVVAFTLEGTEGHDTYKCDDEGLCGIMQARSCSTTTTVVVDTAAPAPRPLAMVDTRQSCTNHLEDQSMSLDREVRLEGGDTLIVDDESFELGDRPVWFPLRDRRNTREHVVPVGGEVEISDGSVFRDQEE